MSAAEASERRRRHPLQIPGVATAADAAAHAVAPSKVEFSSYTLVHRECDFDKQAGIEFHRDNEMLKMIKNLGQGSLR